MKYTPCQQGTKEWLALRAGACTASCFADAVGVLTRASGDKKAGDPTSASDRYASDLAMELISGAPYGEPPKAWILQRGHDLEPLARHAYERKTGNIAMEAGVVKTDDGRFGYSTDGIVGMVNNGDETLTCEGLIEIKCPIDSQKILDIRRTGDLSEYRHQMQGGMWITGAKWCDFIMYVPDLANAGRELYVQRVPRDDNFIGQLELQLLAFWKRVVRFEALLRA